MPEVNPIETTVAGLLAQLPSEDSRRAYRSDWARYTAWLASEGVEVPSARPRHVAAHVAALQAQGKAKSTISRALSVIREIYGGLVRDELIDTNPAREVKNPKMDATPKTPWLHEAAMVQLLNLPAKTWRERRDRLCVQLLFGLGWRRSEVARLKIEDFGPAFVTVSGKLKGNKPLTVGVPEWLQTGIVEWCGFANINKGPILPRSNTNPSAISGDIIYQIMMSATAQAGVEQVSPHAIRRTNITLGGERGVDLKSRQLAVGHSSQATTERYDRARETSKNAPGQIFADMIKSKKEN